MLARIRDGYTDPARLLTVVAEVAAPELRDEPPKDLRNLYRNERDVTSHAVPERILRRAAALLSPFDKGGLGTFDELTLIPDIDDVYLYFEQLIFYRERGPQAE